MLEPEQIIVLGEYRVKNLTGLQIYYRSFIGRDDNMPPALVGKPTLSDRVFLLDYYPTDVERLQAYFDLIDGVEDVYYLMDGNHKSVARVLAGLPVKALEMEADEDFADLDRMVDEGAFFNIPEFPQIYNNTGLVEGELRAALTWLEENLSKLQVLTLRERVDLLVSNHHVPEYMIRRYRE